MNRDTYDKEVLTLSDLEASANKKLDKATAGKFTWNVCPQVRALISYLSRVLRWWGHGSGDVRICFDMNPSTALTTLLAYRVRANMEAFNRYRIRPRILVNVDRVDMSVDFCGYKVRHTCIPRRPSSNSLPDCPLQCAMPLGFSPTAFQKMAHPDGEGGTSRAAASAGIPMILSTYSTTSIEDVVKAGQGQGVYCMQLSVMKSRAANLEILKRAEGKSSFQHWGLFCRLIWFDLRCSCRLQGRHDHRGLRRPRSTVERSPQ